MRHPTSRTRPRVHLWWQLADHKGMASPDVGSNGASVALRAQPTSPRLAEPTRRLLEVLGRISGLESTYLTLVDVGQQVQHILYARNIGDLEIPEGLQVDWSDTLCRRALEGGPASTSEVPELYPDSGVARDLGIQTYVTFPVMDAGGEVFGTCVAPAAGASSSARTSSWSWRRSRG